jgi:hypothetical protein
MILPIPDDNDGSEVILDDSKIFGVFIVVCFGVMVSVYSCQVLKARWYPKIRRDMENNEDDDEHELPPYSMK